MSILFEENMPNEISTMSVLFHTENPSLSIHVIAWVIKTKVLNTLIQNKGFYNLELEASTSGSFLCPRYFAS